MNLNLNVECNGVYSWHMLLKINSVFFGQLSLSSKIEGNPHHRLMLQSTLIIVYRYNVVRRDILHRTGFLPPQTLISPF